MHIFVIYPATYVLHSKIRIGSELKVIPGKLSFVACDSYPYFPNNSSILKVIKASA